MADFNNSVFINYVFQDKVVGTTRSLTVYCAGNNLTTTSDYKFFSSPSQPPYVFLGGGGTYALQIIWVPATAKYYLQYGIGLSSGDIAWANFKNSSDGKDNTLLVNPNRTETFHIVFFNDTSIKIGGRYNFVGNSVLPNIFGSIVMMENIPPCSEFVRIITNNETNIVGPPFNQLQPINGYGVNNDLCLVNSTSVCSNAHLIPVGLSFVRYVNHTGDNIYHTPIGTDNISVNPGFNLISVVLAAKLLGIDTFYTRLLKLDITYYPLPSFTFNTVSNPLVSGGSDGSFSQEFFGTYPLQIDYSGGNLIGTQTQTFPNPGPPPATYQLGSFNVGNLTAGTYTLDLTDACGITLSNTITISDPPPFFINFDSIVTPADGIGCTTVVTTVNTNFGGISDIHWYYPNGEEIPIDPPDEIHISQITGPLVLTLRYPEDPHGTYTFQLASGVQYTFIPPTALMHYIEDAHTTCGSETGILTETITGGSSGATYTYQWFNEDDLNTVIGTTQSIVVLPGNYLVDVKSSVYDQSNQTTTNVCFRDRGKMIGSDPLILTTNSYPSSLTSSQLTGIIFANVTGGTLPYTYAWTKNNVSLPNTTDHVENTSGGTYEVNVTDKYGCTESSSYFLEINDGSEIDAFNCSHIILKSSVTDTYASCTTDQGTLTVDIINTGALQPIYDYKWYNISDLNTIINTTDTITGPVGTYLVFITDTANNLCSSASGKILAAPELTTTIESQPLTVDCAGNFATIYVNVTGGVSPYTYEWKFNNATINNIGDQVTNAYPGIYQVTVTDGNGCVSTQTYNLLIVQAPAFAAYIVNNYVNSITNLGTMTVNIINSQPGATYTYKWYNINNFSTIVSTQSTMTGPVGTYYVYVEDTTNKLCSNASGMILQVPELQVTMDSQSAQLKFLTDTAVIFANVSGGIGPFTYNWKYNNASIAVHTDHVTNATAGDYEVTVTDSTGQTMTNSYSLIFAPMIIFDVFVNNAVASPITNLGTLVATIINSAPNPNYNYMWYNVNDLTTIISTSPSITVPAGTYYVSVTDANNNLYDSATGSVIDSPPLTATIFAEPAVLQSFDDRAVIVVVASGGTAPYTYAWKYNGDPINNTKSTLSNTDAGLYEIIVTDSNNLSVTVSYELTKPLELELKIIKKCNTYCDGCSHICPNGELYVQVSGGVQFEYDTNPDGYLFTWINSITGKIISNQPKITHLRAGVYQVIVTDRNNNTKTKKATLYDIQGCNWGCFP